MFVCHPYYVFASQIGRKEFAGKCFSEIYFFSLSDESDLASGFTTVQLAEVKHDGDRLPEYLLDCLVGRLACFAYSWVSQDIMDGA